MSVVTGALGGALTTAQAQRTAVRHHPRQVALFGGSFDPIHNGHLAVARAADRRFNFDEILFIPASRPPHKLKQHLAPFAHRFAMAALACAEHPHFVPSIAEAGDDFTGQQLYYSVDTVRYFKHVYTHPGDRLFFLIGADAFRHSHLEGVRNAARPVRLHRCQPTRDSQGSVAPGHPSGFARSPVGARRAGFSVRWPTRSRTASHERLSARQRLE
ncbi:MAG: hypothetical protein DMG33_17165 [Acidobacteria bacterium]|nr:MAG: hypothetical protein DMG33_17165 [Acidobacteriota bacterium]